MSTTPNTPSNNTFPRTVELTIKLKFSAEDQEQQDDIVDSNGNCAFGLKADIFSFLLSECGYPLEEIDGTSYSEVRQVLQATIK